jgi:hypothetical protein
MMRTVNIAAVVGIVTAIMFLLSVRLESGRPADPLRSQDDEPLQTMRNQHHGIFVLSDKPAQLVVSDSQLARL